MLSSVQGNGGNYQLWWHWRRIVRICAFRSCTSTRRTVNVLNFPTIAAYAEIIHFFPTGRSMELGAGAILDLGVYMLQFQQFVFRGLTPLKIVTTGHLNASGSDESAGAVITYPGGKMAVVSTSARVVLPNEAVVVGTKGTLRIPQFWCPTTLISPEKTYTFPLPTSKVPFLHTNSAGLQYQALEARKCILAGKIECAQMTHNESIGLARLMDTMRREVGVVFPEDSQHF